jgi:hypothetical protein
MPHKSDGLDDLLFDVVRRKQAVSNVEQLVARATSLQARANPKKRAMSDLWGRPYREMM